MRVAITGAHGFIAKNLRARLALDERIEVLEITRKTSEADRVERLLAADFIFHLAGVNRPQDPSEFTVGNAEFSERVIEVLRAHGRRTPLLLASSIQAEQDNPYGTSKRAAELSTLAWADETDAPVFIYRLPGVFGKWCRPNYNSVVATFCHNLTHGIPLQVSDPHAPLVLAYIDDVVEEFTWMLHNAEVTESGFRNIDRTFALSVGELRERLEAIHDARSSLLLPDMSDPLNAFLYASYTSYLDEANFAYSLRKNEDVRGWLAEFIKSPKFGQVFISKTKPGVSRGNHWHQTKVEKFLIVSGTGEITFRHTGESQRVIRFRVSGDEQRVLDIPVGYVHAITNVGVDDLVTIFWASEIFDPQRPDTFFENVEE